jgi:excinuclease ABC subunit C
MQSLKDFLKTLPHSPGVYLMHDVSEVIIYVGKAKNLYKRVNSYFSKHHEDLKTQALVRDIHEIKITVTRSEEEALILENHLIRTHKPKYNIIFKDDKSYPYVYLSTQHPFPQLMTYRGARKKEGLSFGPYPSASSTRETLQWLQKIFPLRSCTDSFFKSRSRPCLQYQLKRCSAPCVKKITQEDYAKDVLEARLFLEGKSQQAKQALAARMEAASENLEFERAASLRDQIQALQKLQSSQAIFSGTEANVDVIALRGISGFFALAVLMIRGGRVLGTRLFFPERLVEHLPLSDEGQGDSLDANDKKVSSIFSAFTSHFYSEGAGGANLPAEVYFAEKLSKLDLEELSAWMPVGVKLKSTRDRLSVLSMKWIEMATLNADQALRSKFSDQFLRHERIEAFKKTFGLADFSEGVCFDISHSLGESTVASCVVFDRAGPHKKGYRRFNLPEAGGDDYSALKEAVSRYFSKRAKESTPLPSLLLIDGGLGQLHAVMSVLSDFEGSLKVLSISKAEFRTSGFEQIWEAGHTQSRVLDPSDLALHFLQEMRDEAHRFALAAHRKQRVKRRLTSVLEHIPGVGPKRRQALLNHFGSLDAVKSATVDDLLKVPGVSVSLAKKMVAWRQSR